MRPTTSADPYTYSVKDAGVCSIRRRSMRMEAKNGAVSSAPKPARRAVIAKACTTRFVL